MTDTQTKTKALSGQAGASGGRFLVMATGQIEYASLPSTESLYLKYSFVFGPDWSLVQGLEEGLTQISRQREGVPDDRFVWNFPLEATFKSTNPFGWPQLAVRVYGVDGFGREVVKGYGSIHLPLVPGPRTLHIPLFAPISSSKLQGFTSWLTGQPPEYVDSTFAAKADGREVTRVSSEGHVAVNVSIVTKDYSTLGYSLPSNL